MPRSSSSSAAIREIAVGYAIAAVGCRAAGAFTGRCPHGDRRRSQPADIRTASLREVAIKSGLGRADFRADARFLRRGLLDNGYDELAITGEHAVAIANLPPIHEDPFDRLLVAQSAVEGILLLTADPIVAQYPGPIRKV
jgi:PIN domain nuclease of toxin-antitoxin system